MKHKTELMETFEYAMIHMMLNQKEMFWTKNKKCLSSDKNKKRIIIRQKTFILKLCLIKIWTQEVVLTSFLFLFNQISYRLRPDFNMNISSFKIAMTKLIYEKKYLDLFICWKYVGQLIRFSTINENFEI